MQGNPKIGMLIREVLQYFGGFPSFDKKFHTDRRPVPAAVPIYVGMKLFLTQNVRKADDYVNGMECTVLEWQENQQGGVLVVRTSTGKRLPITRWTDAKKKVNYFPIRVGYASTIHKAQGGEFKHVTVYMNAPYMPAAGYTALSRVSTSDDYLVGGIVKRRHFVPATFSHPAHSRG